MERFFSSERHNHSRVWENCSPHVRRDDWERWMQGKWAFGTVHNVG